MKHERWIAQIGKHWQIIVGFDPRDMRIGIRWSYKRRIAEIETCCGNRMEDQGTFLDVYVCLPMFTLQIGRPYWG